jgi:hypothetical protein
MEFQPALRLRAESKRIDIGYWRIDNQSGERVQQPVQIVARFAITL